MTDAELRDEIRRRVLAKMSKSARCPVIIRRVGARDLLYRQTQRGNRLDGVVGSLYWEAIAAKILREIGA